jgi:protein O-mannosyl-transferase
MVDRKKAFQAFVIVILCFIIYLPSLQNGFIWDDSENIYSSPWIKSTEGLRVIWLSREMYQYYPLTFTTFWLEHKLWGLYPFGYHAVNLDLHILNALLVFLIVLQLYPRLAFLSALLFAIHPIQVGTVARITECKNLLSLFFFLLAVLAYLHFERKQRLRYYLIAVSMFACALLSKPIAICFIFFPVLYGWWREGRVTRRQVRLSVAFVVIGLMSAFYTLNFEFLYNLRGRSELFHLTFPERFLLSGRIILFYIYKICLPFNFMFFYPRWPVNIAVWWQWLFTAGVGLIVGALIYYRKTIGRGALALFIFYLISIFPVTGFMNVYGMSFSFVADHFSYFSTPALLLLLCASLAILFDRLRISRVIKGGFFGLAVVYLCAESMALTGNYKNDHTLWNNLIKQDPKSWPAYVFLGLCSKPKDALPLYDKAIQFNPDCVWCYANRGRVYQNQGNLSQALLDYNKAIQVNPGFDLAYSGRGVVYYLQNDLDQAIADFSRAIAIYPHDATPYYYRAMAYFQRQEYGKSWDDVHKTESLGYKMAPEFLKGLKKASGREK